jgi:hypothetical protein
MCWHDRFEAKTALGETGRFSETTPCDPRSPYSASKAAQHAVAGGLVEQVPGGDLVHQAALLVVHGIAVELGFH